MTAIVALALLQVAATTARDDFANPPAAYRPQPFWHLNGTLTDAEIQRQMADAAKAGFGGVAALPVSETRPGYLSEEWFQRYATLLTAAQADGLRVIYYDDLNFPSGAAAGAMQRLHPEQCAKRLDKVEQAVTGPAAVELKLPRGIVMAAVAMNTATKARLDLAASVGKGVLKWQAPAGAWQVMAFVLVPHASNLVDYLDPQAVDTFIGLTYGEHQRRWPKAFGSTVAMGFFDDISFFGHRFWTESFNARFKAKYRRDPALWYPALWYDIGPETDAARAALFGLRNELMADGFPRRVGDWARAHGIAASGHSAGNYEVCPVDMGGDGLKFYRGVDWPLLDAIFYHGHGREGFKLVSSAATNWDKPVVVAEAGGAYSEASTDAKMLYRTAMELFARGVTLLVPHGLWYDPQHVRIPPLISPYSAKLAPALPDFNAFAGRCCRLLRGGRSVTDLAVFYPIDTLDAWFRFDDPRNPRFGTFVPPGTDYLRLSDALTGAVRRDFTFVHPEVLAQRCRVDGATLRLDNAVDHQAWRAVILPAVTMIDPTSLARLRQFYEQGGTLLATTRLPARSTRPGGDAEVQRSVRDLFGDHPAPTPADVPCVVRIALSGPTISTFLNGVLVDRRDDATFARGAVGLREAPEEASVFGPLTVTAADGATLLREDFRGDLTQWLNPVNAVARDGQLALHDNQVFRSVAGAAWRDYTVEVALRDPESVAGVVFRAQDDANYYMWQFRPAERLLRPHVRQNGGWRVLEAVALPSFDDRVTPYTVHRHPRGGRAIFAPTPTAGTLAAALAESVPVADVAFEPNQPATSHNGQFSYLHKVVDGRDVYLLANSTDDPVVTTVVLRGPHQLERWDPHSGQIGPLPGVQSGQTQGQTVTRVPLSLPAATAVLWVGTERAAP